MTVIQSDEEETEEAVGLRVLAFPSRQKHSWKSCRRSLKSTPSPSTGFSKSCARRMALSASRAAPLCRGLLHRHDPAAARTPLAHADRERASRCPSGLIQMASSHLPTEQASAHCSIGCVSGSRPTSARRASMPSNRSFARSWDAALPTGWHVTSSRITFPSSSAGLSPGCWRAVVPWIRAGNRHPAAEVVARPGQVGLHLGAWSTTTSSRLTPSPESRRTTCDRCSSGESSSWPRSAAALRKATSPPVPRPSVWLGSWTS